MPSRSSCRSISGVRIAALAALAIIVANPGAGLRAPAYEVPEETRQRLRSLMPRTYAKLAKRDPVHIAVVGDSVSLGFGYGDMRESTLTAYPGIFAAELAKEFFYTGGVREVAPVRDNPEKLEPALGPEITIENFSRGGAEVFYAFGPLTTTAFDNDPDLLILEYGINDSRQAMAIPRFAGALDILVNIARAKGVDVMIVGATPTLNDDARADFGLLRPYVGAAGEVAEKNGIFFAAGDELMVSGVHRPSDEPPEASRAFVDIVERLRASFDHGPQNIDWIHPSPSGHRLMGTRLARALLRPDAPPGIGFSGSVQPSGPGTYDVSLTLRNLTEQEISAVIVPFPSGLRLVPAAADPPGGRTPSSPSSPGAPSKTSADFAVTLGAGATKNLTLSYKTTSGEPYEEWEEAFMRVPLLVTDAAGAHLVNVNCPLFPCGVTWSFSSGINLAKEFTVAAEVSNPTGEALAGSFTATWRGAKVEGTLSVPAGGTQPLALAFPFPDENAPEHVAHWVRLEINAGNQVHRFRRAVEAARNIGLASRHLLYPAGRFITGAVPENYLPDEGEPSASLRAEADKNTLFCILDIENHELVDLPGGLSAVQVELGFDGRYFEFRGTPGLTGLLTFTCAAADGPLEVRYPRLATLGSGYDRPIPSRSIPAALSTRPDGTRRITIEIPRSFFYLHEWAIGNGNSSLGINATVRLLAVDDANPGGTFPPNLTFFLCSPGIPRRDAQGLATLELTSEPTNRWRMYVY